jgi:hypothetical protein
MLDLNALLTAFATAHYVLGGAILVGALVALAKQGWLSDKIARWCPPYALPWIAMGLGVVTTSDGELLAGGSFWPAVRDGILSGVMAVMGHQTLIEGFLKGRELVPQKSPDGPSDDGDATKPVVVPNISRRASSVPPPAAAALAICMIVLGLAVLVGCISSAPIVPETPANAEQISTCQTTATEHNGVVVGDMIVGVGATTLASTSAALPPTNASGRAVTATVAAVLAGITGGGAGLAAFYASNFQNSNCGVVVGALPSVAAGPPAVLVDAGHPADASTPDAGAAADAGGQ